MKTIVICYYKHISLHNLHSFNYFLFEMHKHNSFDKHKNA